MHRALSALVLLALGVAMGLAVGLDGHAHYLHWGVVQISWANLIVVVVMLALFVAALVVPFPPGRGHDHGRGDDDDRA